MEKKKTAKMSDIIKYLEGMIEEVGDLGLFCLDVTEDAEGGDVVTIRGLAAMGALMAAASDEQQMFMLFTSDEEIKPQ